MEGAPKLTERHWSKIFKFADGLNTPGEIRQAMVKTQQLFQAAFKDRKLLTHVYHFETYKFLAKKLEEMHEEQ